MDEAGDSTFPNWPEFRRLFAYDNLIGKVVGGRYEIVRRLGAGGMGVVFLARHVHLDKPFALKIISPRFLDEPAIGERFLLEARAASKIDHPNVVSITDFGPPAEGPAFFAMEHLGGEDLAQLLAREGPLPWPRVLPIVTQIARALAAAHQRGVVHRDIKPQNCFRVTRDGDPDFIKVLDFGLAKVLSGTGKSAWTVGGSPGYIAPEIYRGGKTDHRVDIFALGVLMYTLLIGRLPAQAPEDVALPEGAPVLHASDLPPALRELVGKAMHEEPARRHADADALLAELAALRGALAQPAVPESRSVAGPPPTRRWPVLAAAGAGALTLTLALVWGRGGGADRVAERSGAAGVEQRAREDVPGDRSPGARAGVAGRDTAGAARSAGAADSAAGTASAVGLAPVPGDSPVAARADPPKAADGDGASAGLIIPVPGDRLTDPAGDKPADPSPVPADRPETGTPAVDRPDVASPVPADRSTPRPRPGPFDEAAARALLKKHAGRVAACKADSSFRGMATTVRLNGTVRINARGKASVALPPGYDVNACIEAVVGALGFRASATGGEFSHVFML